uniref:Uncharacterized protein n=1 Tax=Arundo donax TaxID=35708 RepID=A0A0A8Z7Y9_ARUDO
MRNLRKLLMLLRRMVGQYLVVSQVILVFELYCINYFVFTRRCLFLVPK